MALTGQKRPAAASKAEKQKRRKVMKDCKLVSKSFSDADLPRPVKAMLKKIAPHALNEYKEDRHGYQVKAVGFVGDVMAGIDVSLKGAVSQAQAKVDGAGEERTKRELALISAAKDLAARKGEAAMKDAKVVEMEIAHGHTVEQLKEAQHAAKAPLKEYEKVAVVKTKLQEIIDTTWPAIKNVADKKSVVELGKALDSLGVNTTLLEALQYTLEKAPEAREEFDKLSIKGLDDALAAKMKAVDEEVGQVAPAKAKATQAVESAQAAEEKAKAELDAATAAVKAGKKEVKDALASVEAAATAVKQFHSDAAQDAKALLKVQKKTASFAEGPMAAFQNLKELAKPPPPPVEDETPAPAAEPAS